MYITTQKGVKMLKKTINIEKINEMTKEEIVTSFASGEFSYKKVENSKEFDKFFDAICSKFEEIMENNKYYIENNGDGGYVYLDETTNQWIAVSFELFKSLIEQDIYPFQTFEYEEPLTNLHRKNIISKHYKISIDNYIEHLEQSFEELVEEMTINGVVLTRRDIERYLIQKGVKMANKKYEVVKENGVEVLKDKNNNKIYLNKYTIEEATTMLDSLKSCRGCINCSDCEKCKDCEECKNCYDCVSCIKCFEFCSNCTNCQNCKSCRGCINCKNCYDCDECKNCFDCKNLNKKSKKVDLIH